MEYKSNRLLSVSIGMALLMGAAYFLSGALESIRNVPFALDNGLIVWIIFAICFLVLGLFCLVYRVIVKIDIQTDRVEETIRDFRGVRTKFYRFSDFKEVAITNLVHRQGDILYGVILLGKDKVVIPGIMCFEPGLFRSGHKLVMNRGRKIANDLNLPFREETFDPY